MSNRLDNVRASDNLLLKTIASGVAVVENKRWTGGVPAAVICLAVAGPTSFAL
jgi:hypothetical protein